MRPLHRIVPGSLVGVGLLWLSSCALEGSGTRRDTDSPRDQSTGGGGQTGGTGGSGGAPITSPATSGTGGAPDDPPPCVATDASLIACFSFNDATPADGSGNAFVPDTAEGLAFAPGKDGDALVMSASSKLRFPHDSRWLAEAVTMELWLNPTALPEIGSRAGILDSTGKYAIFLMPGGVLRCFAGVERTTVEGIAAGRWTHIACLTDGETQLLYIDGREVDRVESGPALDFGEQPIHIGSNEPEFDSPFDGQLDTFRVWGRALTPAEICKAAGRDGC